MNSAERQKAVCWDTKTWPIRFKAMRQIAAKVGGVYNKTDSQIYKTGSYNDVLARLTKAGFEYFLNLNKRHWGGTDYQGVMNGNWYHVTVGYPYSKVTWGTFSWNGNTSSVSYGYDSRLAPSRFHVASASITLGAQYQRDGDGRVSYSQDLADPQFDRSYSYDNLGRITQGLTGAEARNASPADGPYKQTYSYDPFSNLTSRTGRHWTHNVSAQTNTFVNNRNAQWQYDADGRPTQAGAQQFKYDAAGRDVASSGTIVDTYDGEGNRVKLPLTSGYDVRSSVLQGQVITHITSQGQKGFTNVYSNGNPIGNEFAWDLKNPINSGSISVFMGGVVMREKEFSPIGDNVGIENPYLYGGGGDGGYPAYGDPSSFKCAWDNVEINCSSLNKFYISKNNAWFLTLVIRAHVGRVMRETKAELVPGAGGDKLGGVVAGDADITQPGAKPSSVEIIGLPDPFELRDVGTLMTWVSMQAIQRIYLLPQNTAPNENGIREGLKKALSNPACQKLVDALLNAVATKKNPLLTQYTQGGIMGMFEAVMLEDGLTRNPPPGSAGHGSPIGNIAQGNAQIFVESRPFGPADQLQADVKGVLAELMHLAGQKASYTDRAFADIVHRDYPRLTTSIWPDDKSYKFRKDALKNDNHIGWSYYWHYAVNRTCF